MSLTRLLTSPFLLESAIESIADGYGNQYPTPGIGAVVMGYLEPAGEIERLGEQETYVTTSRFLCAAGTVIAAGDTVIPAAFIDAIAVPATPAQRFHVIEALHLTNPRTAKPHHVECKVREVVG